MTRGVCPQKAFIQRTRFLCGQDAGAAGVLDLLLSLLREELSLDGDGLLRELALAKAFEDSELSNKHLISACSGGLLLSRSKPAAAAAAARSECRAVAKKYLGQVNEGCSAVVLLGILLALLETHHAPKLIHIDGGHVVRVLLVVEVPHTHLTEVSRVILVESNSVHVLATSVTATGSVLAVLADTAVTAVHATALFPVLLLGRRLHTIVMLSAYRPDANHYSLHA